VSRGIVDRKKLRRKTVEPRLMETAENASWREEKGFVQRRIQQIVGHECKGRPSLILDGRARVKTRLSLTMKRKGRGGVKDSTEY